MRVKTRTFSALILIILIALSTANTAHAIGVTKNITIPSTLAQESIPRALAEESPSSIAYDSNKSELFVCSIGDISSNEGAVSVISDSNNSVIATIPVGNFPCGLAYDSGKGEIYVTNSESNSVSVISDSSNKVVATIPVGPNPDSAAYDSGKGEIYVTNYDSNSVSVISDSSNKVIATINVGSVPYDVAYDSAKGEIFVVNNGWVSNGSGTVSVISDSNNSVVATVDVGQIPMGAAYDSSKGEIYVTSYYDNTVSVISDSSNMVVATIPVGVMPCGIAYDSRKGEIFVSTVYSDSLSVISDSNNSVVATVPVGNQDTGGVAYDSGKGEIFVANGAVSVVSDSSTLTAPNLFAFPSMISLNQTSKLTSSVVTSGNPPYTYQWFSEAPGNLSYTSIGNANTSSYNFAASNSTVEGNWKFILQVTGFTGGSVNSTAASVTVTAPPLSSATLNATATNWSATLNMSASTGVNVTVSGSSLQNGTVIRVASANYGDEQPSGTGAISVSAGIFYDVSIASSSGAFGSDVYANVSFSNPQFTSSSVVEYWNGSSWVLVATTFNAPDSVSGTIPASALTGTPIVVSVLNSTVTSGQNWLLVIFGLVIGLAITAVVLSAVMLITRDRKRKLVSNQQN